MDKIDKIEKIDKINEMYRIRLDSIRLSPQPHLPCSYLKSSASKKGGFPMDGNLAKS